MKNRNPVIKLTDFATLGNSEPDGSQVTKLTWTKIPELTLDGNKIPHDNLAIKLAVLSDQDVCSVDRGRWV